MKIGITLGGGLAKGAFQFGFLKALLEYIPREDIEVVSTASVGIINGYALCANKMDEVENLWRTMHYDTLAKMMFDCWFHGRITKIVKNIVTENDELEIPMYATITYLPIIPVGRYYYVDGKYNKKWRKFFRAGMGFPFVTGAPKFYKGILTIDGGAFDNIPVYPLVMKHNLDLIIAIHFDSKYILEQTFRESNTIVLDLDASLGNDLRKCSFKFNTIVLNKMLDGGYEYGKRVCKKLFESGYGNIEGIRKSVDDLYDEEFELRMKEGTLDRLITTLNGFSQIFRKEKSIKKLIKEKGRDKNDEATGIREK